MIDLSGFNEQQYLAITCTDPYLKVVAGAGSGKTAVLTNRIAYLVEKRHVNERNILAITFTNKAAKEMKERVLKLLEKEVFLGLITTFHSFCLRVLREDINVIDYSRDFIILDTDDQKAILKQINKKLNYDRDVFNTRALVAYISNQKNNYYLDNLDDYTKEVYDEFFYEYEALMKKSNYLDFDDLIIKCVELFKKTPHILDKWRYRYNYIHVDEFQDTNEVQYELIKLLALDLNVFVVGDPDQTIYTWRGARIDYIMNFEADFVGTTLIKLEYNYRSQQAILDAANALIENNTNRHKKTLLPTILKKHKVIHYVGEDASAEADYVVDKINELITENDEINYDDFAILYRSNYISRIFEQRLLQANIDYQIIGGTKFFERKEVKDVLAYLKTIVYEDDLSLLRIINTPKRKIGEVSLTNIIDYANKYHLSYYQVIKDNLNDIKLGTKQKEALNELVDNIENLKQETSASLIISYVIENINILEEYQTNPLDYQKREENIKELFNYALQESQDITTFLQDIALDSSYEDGEGYRVNLLSMHKAKGLEFKYVFVVYLCDGIFPSMYALDTLDLEEERRLAYVSFTRAKEQLFLLSHLYNERYFRMSPSIFVKEIDSDLLEKQGRLAQEKIFKPYRPKEINIKEVIANENNFNINDIVHHPIFKKGVVIDINDNVLTIAFEHNIGIKTIAANFVEKEKKQK